ncbi:MAG: hypothetical protein QXF56_00190 [Candidatus Micrarchaeia archaeon]
MRGQIGLEFFIAFSFLILLFLISLAVYEQERKSADVFLSKEDAEIVALNFARAINGVHQCGDGCSYRLYFKEGYVLSISGRVLEAVGNSQIGEAALVTERVRIYSATPGKFVEVRNNNGMVELHDV